MFKATFAYGDRVVHASRPEWGVGQIVSVQSTTQDGRSAQKLGIRFDRAGLKTLSTAHADLRPASETASAGGGGWLAELERASPVDALVRLPEETRDPFASLEARLRATLDLYRFGRDGAALMDWAAAQSGLSDPLSQYNRQELEQHFQRFEGERDAHLKRLVGEARRVDPAALARAAAGAPAAGAQAMRRFDASR